MPPVLAGGQGVEASDYLGALGIIKYSGSIAASTWNLVIIEKYTNTIINNINYNFENMPSATPSYDEAVDLIRCIRFWRRRYNIESGPVLMDRHILTSEDRVGIEDPIFSSETVNIATAVRHFLGRDRSFFDKVEQQLQSTLQIWGLILQQKQRYDDLQGKAVISGNREVLEALLLCGRLIPARSYIVPAPREASSNDAGKNPQRDSKRHGYTVVEPREP